MMEIVNKFVEDIRKKLFRSWYDDVSYSFHGRGIENDIDESDCFMLMINNFSYPGVSIVS